MKFLESAGHSTDIVENGALAVEAVKSNYYGFDLILMDLSMPLCGGVEATGLIRQYESENGLDRIPIVALTAHAMYVLPLPCFRFHFLPFAFFDAFHARC